MAGQSTSVSSLIREAEERQLQEVVAGARTPSLSVVQIRQSLGEMIRSKVGWIQRFSEGRNKRPDHEIVKARAQLASLVQARDLLKGDQNAPDRGG